MPRRSTNAPARRRVRHQHELGGGGGGGGAHDVRTVSPLAHSLEGKWKVWKVITLSARKEKGAERVMLCSFEHFKSDSALWILAVKLNTKWLVMTL